MNIRYAERCVALCETTGTMRQRFIAAHARWVNRRVAGRARELEPLVEEIAPYAAPDDLEHRAAIHRMRSQTYFDLGRLHEADAEVTSAVALLEQVGRRDLEWGNEPLVQSHWYEALIALLLGRATHAERLIDAVAAEARALGHTSTLATCLGHVGYFYAIAREFDLLRTSMQELRDLADSKSMPQWQANSRVLLGLTESEPRDAVAATATAIERLEQVGMTIFHPAYHAWTAERALAYDPGAARAARTCMNSPRRWWRRLGQQRAAPHRGTDLPCIRRHRRGAQTHALLARIRARAWPGLL